MRVAVLLGGDSDEQEISILSGQAVLQALIRQGHDAFTFDPAQNDIRQLEADVAFICLHGRHGEDGSIQGALEMLNIPYTGSGVLASALCFNKLLTKLYWLQLDIAIPNGISLSKQEFNNIMQDYNYNKNELLLDLNFSYPCLVKPTCNGSSLGVNKVLKQEDLIYAIEDSLNYSDQVLIEELILGGEFAITIINGADYDIVKIIANDDDYNFYNKYYSNDTQYIYPYHFKNLELEQEIINAAIKTYNEFGCSGAIRIDFMTNRDETEYFFLEVNTISGMTDHSLVPKSVSNHEINFDQLCSIILSYAKKK